MERLKSAGGQIDRDLGIQEQILVENEFYFVIADAVNGYFAGTGMDLYTATAPDGQLRIHAAAADRILPDILFTQ